MSTLTKVLIVLLSLFSIFLSGAMVTFVANSSNFKEKADNLIVDLETLQGETARFDQRYAAKSTQMKQQEVASQTRIQELELLLSTSKLDQQTAETARDDFEIKYKTINGTLAGLVGTIASANETKDILQVELRKALEDLNNRNAELNESEANLHEKMVSNDKLYAKVKRLLEKNAIYETQIVTLANGNPVTFDEPVTMIRDFATAAPAAPSSVTLKGLVTEVFENDVVISLGSADGVTKKTVFHISRGAEFVCNVKITSVDTNKSAGIIKLKLEQPKIGDTAKNEL